MEIAGKVVALTGAGNGIGEALALRLAAHGARVVVSDLREVDALRVADAIVRTGGRAIGVGVDAGSETDIRQLVDTAVQAYGPVDILCSNAGIVDEGDVDAPDRTWMRSWKVNVMAHVYAARAVLPAMRARGSGYLVNTCSAAGLLTSPGAAPYAVTKHAAVALAEWLAIEHGDAGIRVSVICPQAVRTQLLQDSIAAGNDASRALSQSARMLEPDDVARCAIEGIRQERFLILPHEEVQDFVQRKAQDVDRWLAGMRRFLAQARLAQGAGQ
ncbi:MAG TPA: SDR family oxidoreductase [Ramlibacter sp.]|nr:SDR family oxidoreductase [Ramlibacter sp.]